MYETRKTEKYNVDDITILLGTETKDIGHRLVPYGNISKKELEIEIYGRPVKMTKIKLFENLPKPQYIQRQREFTFREAEEKIGTRVVVFGGHWYTYNLIKVNHLKYFLQRHGLPTTGDKTSMFQRFIGLKGKY